MDAGTLAWAAIVGATLSALLVSALLLLVAAASGRRRRARAVGFFHPFTNDGGGGERVLWCAVKAIQDEFPGLDIAVFTGDAASSESLAARALNRFGVELISLPKVVHLKRRKWIEEGTYPHFTMIGQCLGSVYLAWEALSAFTPLYYFDSCGYAFTYPVARLFGCKVICYTHYPTISSDMVARVRDRKLMYNNDSQITGSIWLSKCKVIYYTILTWMYGWVGSFVHLAMVNSSWTKSHIEKVWKIDGRITRVYPPCDTLALQALPLERTNKPRTIISVAQFRPEKAHSLQLEAFSLALTRLDPDIPRPKLQFVGSCRNGDDERRFLKLKDKSKDLNIYEDVEFFKDISYRDLVQLLAAASVGLHSMIDEHFGISVVEYMAAGAIPIAHNSAGPKMDIVLEEDGQKTGFLCSTVEEFADAIIKVLSMSDTERLDLAAAARKRAARFSETRFYEDFKTAIRPVLFHAQKLKR